MNDSILNMVTIENVNIFNNSTDKRYNSCVIMYRDEKGKPFLLYIEKMYSGISLTMERTFVADGLTSLLGDMALTNQIYPVAGTAFRIVDLSWQPDPPKEMTKEEIEKKLGYKIKII